MTWTYERRIARALELAGAHPQSAGLLTFYTRLARFQSAIFNARVTDLRALTSYFQELIGLVEADGPVRLGADARASLKTQAEQEDLLHRCWETGELKGPGQDEPAKFFARALLQPFAEYLASRGQPDPQSTRPTCPFCNALPAAGVLRGEGDGAKRSLLCSLCATEWQFRRILCPNCGEEDKERLPVYLAEDFGFVRVEACDTCKTYIKSIDLTKNGHAVPMVDELAAVPLAIWADEHGYSKLETNILGM